MEAYSSVIVFYTKEEGLEATSVYRMACPTEFQAIVSIEAHVKRLLRQAKPLNTAIYM